MRGVIPQESASRIPGLASGCPFSQGSFQKRLEQHHVALSLPITPVTVHGLGCVFCPSLPAHLCIPKAWATRDRCCSLRRLPAYEKQQHEKVWVLKKSGQGVGGLVLAEETQGHPPTATLPACSLSIINVSLGSQMPPPRPQVCTVLVSRNTFKHFFRVTYFQTGSCTKSPKGSWFVGEPPGPAAVLTDS